jgi:hypothetical protein
MPGASRLGPAHPRGITRNGAGAWLGGDHYIFRGRRGDLAKIIWHDGVGLSLYAKRLDRGKFIWPSAKEGVSISAAQLLSAVASTAVLARLNESVERMNASVNELNAVREQTDARFERIDRLFDEMIAHISDAVRRCAPSRAEALTGTAIRPLP